MLRIRDVRFIPDPGSEIPSRIPGQKDSGSQIRIRIEEFKYFLPKNCFQDLGIMMWDVHPGSRIRMLVFYPSRIPESGVKKAPDPDPQYCHNFSTLVLYFICCLSPDLTSSLTLPVISKIVRELRNFKKILYRKLIEMGFPWLGTSIRIQIHIPLFFTTLTFITKMAQLFAI